MYFLHSLKTSSPKSNKINAKVDIQDIKKNGDVRNSIFKTMKLQIFLYRNCNSSKNAVRTRVEAPNIPNIASLMLQLQKSMP